MSRGPRMKFPIKSLALGIAIGALALACMGSADNWLLQVPDSYRSKVNPYAGQLDAIQAGHKLFDDYCAQCHKSDALGHGKRPSLRTGYIQNATDGELFWLLRNGILAHGMPSWSMVPEPSRWQIIAYVKSLGPVSGAATSSAVAKSPAETLSSANARNSR
jgi:mono/diheme cytochrome c family protein